MHRKLKWNAVGLEKKTKILLEQLYQNKKNEPESHSKKHRKLDGFIKELTYLLEMMKKIRKELIPSLEKKFKLEFKTPEMVMLALSRPSLRTVFENLNTFFNTQGDNPLKIDDYNEMASSGDAADVLALIGDAVLDLAIIQLLWDSSLSTVGGLSQKRAQIVSNEKLSIICENWKLYDYRLKRLNDPTGMDAKEETIVHEKGTLIESLFGMIYLEFGLEELIRIVPFIQ